MRIKEEKAQKKKRTSKEVPWRLKIEDMETGKVTKYPYLHQAQPGSPAGERNREGIMGYPIIIPVGGMHTRTIFFSYIQRRKPF